MAITKLQAEALNLADTYAFTGTVTGAGESNVPAFAETSSSQTGISSGTSTKMQFDTEIFDSASAFDHSTNYRFTVPSGQAGKYFFYCYSTLGSSNSNALVDVKLFFYKNGSASGKRSLYVGGDTAIHLSLTNVFDLSVGDYIEVYAGVNISSGTVEIRQTDSSFGAYKIIE